VTNRNPGKRSGSFIRTETESGSNSIIGGASSQGSLIYIIYIIYIANQVNEALGCFQGIPGRGHSRNPGCRSPSNWYRRRRFHQCGIRFHDGQLSVSLFVRRGSGTLGLSIIVAVNETVNRRPAADLNAACELTGTKSARRSPEC
jgi:hypothetical protein